MLENAELFVLGVRAQDSDTSEPSGSLLSVFSNGQGFGRTDGGDFVCEIVARDLMAFYMQSPNGAALRRRLIKSFGSGDVGS